jgi:hypothetical protein
LKCSSRKVLNAGKIFPKQTKGRQAEAWLLGNSIIPNANLWLA